MEKITLNALRAVAVLALVSTATFAKDSAPSKPARKHLGRHSFKITTRSTEAQRAFNRGLTWAYSFGHYAAEQEFRAALAADSDCAMAWWASRWSTVHTSTSRWCHPTRRSRRRTRLP